MPRYDEFREMFANASSEERLAIIRSESKRLLSTAQGYSQIVQKIISERKPSELPDQFGEWCKKVEDSVKELQDLIEALTDQKHRSIYQEEGKKRDRELGEMIWRDNQQGLPELKSYSSMADAVDKTSHRLGLSSLLSQTKNSDMPSHPAIVYFRTPERRARIAAQASQRDNRRYLGYVIALEWLSDQRNLKWEEVEGLTSLLDEAVTVLHHWLVEKIDLQTIKQKFPWMSSGIVRRNV
jgi:hypothetical protein